MIDDLRTLHDWKSDNLLPIIAIHYSSEAAKRSGLERLEINRGTAGFNGCRSSVDEGNCCCCRIHDRMVSTATCQDLVDLWSVSWRRKLLGGPSVIAIDHRCYVHDSLST